MTIDDAMSPTWSERHLDLDKGLVTICQQVFGLPVVDPHHPQQQMPRCSKGHFHLKTKQENMQVRKKIPLMILFKGLTDFKAFFNTTNVLVTTS